jgi:hypothetical protein
MGWTAGVQLLAGTRIFLIANTAITSLKPTELHDRLVNRSFFFRSKKRLIRLYTESRGYRFLRKVGNGTQVKSIPIPVFSHNLLARTTHRKHSSIVA